MSRAIPDYDRKKGGQHNFETIIKIFTEWVTVRKWQEKWATILLFDAIIGNTDRHQENWEIYSYFAESGELVEELSPAFDNGTSMGYDILPENIKKRLANLEPYINKGTHHMMWSINDTKHAGHCELLEKLVAKFPQTIQVIKAKLRTDISAIAKEIEQLTEYDIRNEKYKLSKERADFITQLIEFRYNRLRKMFNL